MKGASDFVQLMKHCAQKSMSQPMYEMPPGILGSQVVFGTVTAINPLRIQIDGEETDMPESFFVLSPWCRVNEASFRIRGIHGEIGNSDDKIDIRLKSELINNELDARMTSRKIDARTLVETLNAQTTNASAISSDGSWRASTGTPSSSTGVGGLGYNRSESMGTITYPGASKHFIAGTYQMPGVNSSFEIGTDALPGINISKKIINAETKIGINGKGSLDINFIEKPYRDDTHRDHMRYTEKSTGDSKAGMETGITFTGTDERDSAFYDQTFRIDVITNRGLKVSDRIVMTSHNAQQIYMVWWVMNRGAL